MERKLDYRWHLRQVMASRGMILMALLDILDCSMTELIEPAAVSGGRSRTAKTAGGGAPAGVGQLRPRRARITGAGG
jgi:hypothetical protein